MVGKYPTRWIIGLFIALCMANPAVAGELSIQVLSSNGEPVADVVVFVKQTGIARPVGHTPKAAVMDQRNQRFVPHILVVEKGSRVEFPNSDVVAHHVYSFSRPNDFVLPLYKGTPRDPVDLKHDGIVTLGCNIHDDMLGYIVVVDTNLFGVTDVAGRLSVSVNDGASSFEVYVWSPRIRDSRKPLLQTVAKGSGRTVVFKLQKPLRTAHIDRPDSVEWDEY